MMNYEQILYSMTMAQLVAEAEKYNVKVDKKGSKTKAADKILAAYKDKVTEKEVKTEEVTDEELEETLLLRAQEIVERESMTSVPMCIVPDEVKEEVETVEAEEAVEAEAEEEAVEAEKTAKRTRKAPAKKTAEEFMSTVDIEYTVDKKGRYNFGKKAFYLIFKSNSITMAPTKAFREAHQEVEWDFHEGWSNPYRTAVTEEFVRTAIEEIKKNAEAVKEEVEEK